MLHDGHQDRFRNRFGGLAEGKPAAVRVARGKEERKAAAFGGNDPRRPGSATFGHSRRELGASEPAVRDRAATLDRGEATGAAYDSRPPSVRLVAQCDRSSSLQISGHEARRLLDECLHRFIRKHL